MTYEVSHLEDIFPFLVEFYLGIVSLLEGWDQTGQTEHLSEF